MASGPVPSAFWLWPFGAVLAAIAGLPLVAPRFWARDRNKLLVMLLPSLAVLVRYLWLDPAALVRSGLDYVSFMTLLTSLFVIAGGLKLDGDLPATPRVNLAFLAAGAVLASVVGTAGASMLLVRPLLITNQERRHVGHTVVFFIFLAANVGGCLSPLGDPPLFLGYLAGVPFTWSLRLLPAWGLACGLILGIYGLLDAWMYARESTRDRMRDRLEVRPLRLAGGINLVLLLGIAASAALLTAPFRELAMAGLCLVSLRVTPAGLREANQFTLRPVREVATLFAGIFVTMLPALELLRARGGQLGLRDPWHFFWATGLVSSILDNAPTYLAFLAIAQGLRLAPEVVGVPHRLLEAVSLGAVFMGALTYVGNGPNFMVKAVAEERGVSMPGFGGYLVISGSVLLPVFGLVCWAFLR